MKSLFLIVGAILIITGLVWMGQASGYFPYPRSSFMVHNTDWIKYGAGACAIGIAAIIFAPR